MSPIRSPYVPRAWRIILTLWFIDLICELLRRHSQEIVLPSTDRSRRTYSTKLVKSGKPDKKLDRKKPVLVERRIINHKGQHTHTEVDVKSPALRDILIEINKDVEGLSLLKEPPFVSYPVSRQVELPPLWVGSFWLSWKVAPTNTAILQHLHIRRL